MMGTSSSNENTLCNVGSVKNCTTEMDDFNKDTMGTFILTRLE